MHLKKVVEISLFGATFDTLYLLSEYGAEYV